MVILNPRSFRMGLRNRADRLTALLKHHALPFQTVQSADDIEQGVRTALDEGVTQLVIIGGDGTLQGAATWLARINPASCPRLLMLGGGRTNYTARDLRTHDQLITTLTAALERPEQFRPLRRRTLAVHQQGLASQHGFFIAGGLIDWVIRDCHAYRAKGRGPLRTGHLSSAWRLLQLAGLAMVGAGGYRPPRLTIEGGQIEPFEHANRLLLMTTLEHAGDWLVPYADQGEGTIRLSAVDHRARGFWRRLPRLISGRYSEAMTPSQGYLSLRGDAFRLHGLESISLDGQDFNFDPQRPVDIKTGIELEFLGR